MLLPEAKGAVSIWTPHIPREEEVNSQISEAVLSSRLKAAVLKWTERNE